MGKSAGKWIKTKIFGKKTKSEVPRSKERSANGKEVHVRVMTPETGVDDNHQEVSSGGFSAVHVDKQNSSSEYMEPSFVFIQHDQEKSAPGDQNVVDERVREINMLIHEQKILRGKAVTKMQAALRGYLARRSFKSLEGIIRLQALIRGHLVRRQAVATLHCVMGIVKLQALVRGSRIRCSDAGFEVQRIVKPLDVTARFHGNVGSSSTSSLSENAFIRQLLGPSPEWMPLRVQYDETDPNSVQIWLERWSIYCPWKPVSQPKKATNSKIQKKQGNSLAVESEIVRPKRSVRKAPFLPENPSTQSNSELEKPRRSSKKTSSHPVESALENSQSELEKVKRSLRKVHNPVTESSPPPEVTERSPQSQTKTMTSSVPEVHPNEVKPVENMKEEPVFFPTEADITVPKENDEETTKGFVETSQPIELSNDEISKVKLEYFEGDEKDENTPVSNGELKPAVESTPTENQKSSRRVSLSAKQELVEDGLQSTPKVPSYMQATKSAKAKLRGQASPRLGPDSAEKNNLLRRHSLPSPANGKVSSPRTPKILQGSGKGGNKSDKSLLSSRDGNALPGKATQEWRR